jgi:hypothetical protein
MNKTERKQNRKVALNQYKDKWGLTGYTPFAYYNTLHFFKSPPIDYIGNEIKKLDTLSKRLKSGESIILHENAGVEIQFDSLEELLHYMLVQKISGV